MGIIINKKIPPREYKVGKKKQIKITDCGTVILEPDEQVTFITKTKSEYDITRKNWGYYATPSINGRLKNFHFKTAMVRDEKGMIYIMLVEKHMEFEFDKYIQDEKLTIVDWLDEY